MQTKQITLGLNDYLVYEDGRIWCITRGEWQKTCVDRGYKCFNYPNGPKKQKLISIHQLMARVFLNHIPSGHSVVIDHVSGDKQDNRIDNLRLVSNRENGQNRHSHRRGRLVGCYFNKQKQKWQAQIKTDGVQKYLGLYDTELEAHQAYLTALQSLPR